MSCINHDGRGTYFAQQSPSRKVAYALGGVAVLALVAIAFAALSKSGKRFCATHLGLGVITANLTILLVGAVFARVFQHKNTPKASAQEKTKAGPLTAERAKIAVEEPKRKLEESKRKLAEADPLATKIAEAEAAEKAVTEACDEFEQFKVEFVSKSVPLNLKILEIKQQLESASEANKNSLDQELTASGQELKALNEEYFQKYNELTEKLQQRERAIGEVHEAQAAKQAVDAAAKQAAKQAAQAAAKQAALGAQAVQGESWKDVCLEETEEKAADPLKKVPKSLQRIVIEEYNEVKILEVAADEGTEETDGLEPKRLF